MYNCRWPEHTAWLRQMEEACRGRGVRVFPAIPRRQSIMLMSMAGQDYAPVVAAIEEVARHRPAQPK